MNKNQIEKIMVSGLLQQLNGKNQVTEICRGMKVLTADKHKVGFVAGVLVDAQSQNVIHLLLGYLPLTNCYHMIPSHLISQINDEIVCLKIDAEAIERLEKHQPH